jgi:N-hydroxyarylamine O-acetyltransferase
MITPELVEQVLLKLGFRERPTNDLVGLETLYGRWSRNVPFDNVQKWRFLSSGKAGPLPGHTAEDFFLAWLAHGTGGTCWAVSHALYDLLDALGFHVRRATSTMLSAPGVRGPNHGTVLASIDGRDYLVDGTMLTERPIPIQEGDHRAVQHPGAQIRIEQRDGHWHVLWRPVHVPDGLWCRIDEIGVPFSVFDQWYESTRGWSPFNFSLYARANMADRVTGVAFGNRVRIEPDGQAVVEPISEDERVRLLVEDLGIAEELASDLPADAPLPPRPGV